MGQSVGKLRDAAGNKNDEYYTRLDDINKELRNYKHHFKNKTVYCNCDDPSLKSKFALYFSRNFETLGLKKLIGSCYRNNQMDSFSDGVNEKAVYWEYSGDLNGNRIPDPEEFERVSFKGDGDFRNEENIELLKEADIIVTNPPFSLFREYVKQLIDYDKKFLIVGSNMAMSYQEIYPLIAEGKMWIGCSGRLSKFDVPNGGDKSAAAVWYTNLEHKRLVEPIPLKKYYEDYDYPKYDNLDIIHVDYTRNIPKDYDGIMSVPISFLEKYCPNQFELIGVLNSWDMGIAKLDGKFKFCRIAIKRKL